MQLIKNTIVISLVFFLIIILISVGNYFVNKKEFKIEAVYVFIALVPFIIMLVLSGKLKEISGPGGWTIILRDEARKPLSPELKEMELELDPAIVMDKGTVKTLTERIAQRLPTTLSLQIGKLGYYGEWAIGKYINDLEEGSPHFKNVLFTDELGRFKGFIRANDFKMLMKEDKIVEKIETGRILEDSRILKKSVQIGSTNQQALIEMERVGQNILAVVDRNEKFVGTITQEEIVRKILTKVLREA
jgi:uncharacterized membrane protein